VNLSRLLTTLRVLPSGIDITRVVGAARRELMVETDYVQEAVWLRVGQIERERLCV
jgi:hypothetical protein